MRLSWLPIFLCAALAGATIFGDVRGIIHDPQHRPVGGAQVTIRARQSDWSQTTPSDADGEFEFNAVPLGEYVVAVQAPGFATLEQQITATDNIARAENQHQITALAICRDIFGDLI